MPDPSALADELFSSVKLWGGSHTAQKAVPFTLGELAIIIDALRAYGKQIKAQRVSFDALRFANTERHKEWDPSDKITLAYRGNELAGEVGEACNALKKIERERLGIRGSRDTVEHLAEELADVIICADLIAMKEGIDLGASVAAKFNATSEKQNLSTRIAADAEEGK
jgi:NTP pyrophosphatase (non-canonical NTP hydrolase)